MVAPHGVSDASVVVEDVYDDDTKDLEFVFGALFIQDAPSDVLAGLDNTVQTVAGFGMRARSRDNTLLEMYLLTCKTQR